MIIAADTSAFVNALEGKRDERLTILRLALRRNEVRLAPIVVTELLSTRNDPYGARRFVITIPRLEIADGYWERTGYLRAAMPGGRDGPGIADCLIAQACIDHGIPLITYDPHFEHFKPAGLKLL